MLTFLCHKYPGYHGYLHPSRQTGLPPSTPVLKQADWESPPHISREILSAYLCVFLFQWGICDLSFCFRTFVYWDHGRLFWDVNIHKHVVPHVWPLTSTQEGSSYWPSCTWPTLLLAFMSHLWSQELVPFFSTFSLAPLHMLWWYYFSDYSVIINNYFLIIALIIRFVCASCNNDKSCQCFLM